MEIKDFERALSVGLSAEEYETIVALLGREPNDLELGIFALNWSEHCSYKSSKRFLKLLPSSSGRTVIGPGGGAGVLRLDGKRVVAFKIESHNHPSAVEPKNGAATGVGGIVRDVLSMGVRPVALLDSLRFGDFRKSKKSLNLLKGVVDGISSYGNSIGVPVVGGEVLTDESYEDNPLVNVMCVGIGEIGDLKDGVLKCVGNSVILVGAPTGRDGILGASFASQNLEGDVSEKRPAVQIGDPFMEKLLIEAVLEVVKFPYVLGMQDLGAGGLSTALPEMANKGGVGVELYTDKVPLRESLSPYEIVLSESQERMVLCVERGKEEEVIRIFRKWGLTAEVIGRVIEEKVFRILHNNEVLAEIPLAYIFKAQPKPDWIAIPRKGNFWEFYGILDGVKEKLGHLKGEKKKHYLALWNALISGLKYKGVMHDPDEVDSEIRMEALKVRMGAIRRKVDVFKVKDMAKVLEDYKYFLENLSKIKGSVESVLPTKLVSEICLRVLSRPSVASKRWIYRQYDYMVGTDTVIPPGEMDAAVLRIKGENYGIAITVDGNGKFLEMDPYWGAQRVAAEACANIVCVGGMVIGFTDGVNFPSPADPVEYWKLQEAIRGLADFASYMEIPVVSGNVSLYNQSERYTILPTLIIGAVVIVRNLEKIPNMGTKGKGSYVYLVGHPMSNLDLGGSEFLLEIAEMLEIKNKREILKFANLPKRYYTDTDYVKSLLKAVYEAINSNLVESAHDVSEGGLFSALAEMVIKGKAGIDADVEGFGEMFSELAIRFVLITKKPKALESLLSNYGIMFQLIGKTTAKRDLVITYHNKRTLKFKASDLEKAYYGTFENIG